MLSKKELLQLSPQEIERMVGAELFLKAGKRIRYKTFREVVTNIYRTGTKKTIKARCSGLITGTVSCDRIMTDIDIFDLSEHVDSMIDSGERASTINRKKAVLSSGYKSALIY